MLKDEMHFHPAMCT